MADYQEYRQKRYERLASATKEELLEAAVLFNERHVDSLCGRWVRLGFALAQDNGWEYVAPAWLDDLRKCDQDEPE